MMELYDFQEADVTAALEHDSWLIAYEQGLGKTLAAVEWAKRKGVETVVVVAPLNTFRTWKKTFNEQMPDMPVHYLRSDNKHVSAFGWVKEKQRGVYIIGWELMRTGAMTGQVVDLIIADETHKQANFGRSLQALLIREFHSKYKLALSGTPAANRPDGLFSTLNWLWPKLYPSLWKWVDKYWRSVRNGAQIELVRELVPGQIIADIPMFSRRLKKDHLKDLPGNLPEIEIEVDLTPTQWKIYNRLEKEAGVWLGDDFISAAYPLVQDMRLGAVTLGVPKVNEDGVVTFAENCGSSKIKMLLEVLEDNEGAFLVLTHSLQFVPSVVSQLNKKGIKARGFSGETKQAERDWLIDNLGKEYRVLVAVIAAIGEGTDGLQYVCHNGFWLSKHPSAYLNKQAKERLYRPGQTEPISWWYTLAPGTVDEDRRDRLEDINYALDEMLDNHPVG